MRSQGSNPGQPSGSSDQKKSVFDRLGRQLDLSSSSRSMKRRSPRLRGSYGDYLPPPPMRDVDFGRYGRNSEPHLQEMDWRHMNDHRQLSQFSSRDRHTLPPPSSQLPPPPLPGHYDMEMPSSRVQPPFYSPHPHQAYPPGPPLGSINQPISMRQQRSSPKCDRHGNIIGGMFKERNMGGPLRMSHLDHHSVLSPSRSYMPPASMLMHPAHETPPHDMPPMRARGNGGGSMLPPRWQENLEQPDFPHHSGRMLQEGARFSPLSSRPHQQQQVHLLNPGNQNSSGKMTGPDLPMYAKWRERRDVITTLDRETAQSSSRTDSLKSTLQQQDTRNRTELGSGDISLRKIRGNLGVNKKQQNNNTSNEPQKELNKEATEAKTTTSTNNKDSSLPLLSQQTSGSATTAPKPKPTKKVNPEDISDGEIIDDEDSSDESETVKPVKREHPGDRYEDQQSYLDRAGRDPIPRSSVARSRESHKYYDTSKRRRLLDREDYSMDYETISDEDLDDFMDEKKILDMGSDDTKLDKLREASGMEKSLSEIELLNALGLDWANLVELAKQSKTSSKETYTPGSALPRFSMPTYLPTLGITKELAGPELYGLILKICHD